MSRKLRMEHPGAMYHVMNRGDQREDIFRDDEDRQRVLCTVSEACAKTDWQVHADCLMRNHFHNEDTCVLWPVSCVWGDGDAVFPLSSTRKRSIAWDMRTGHSKTQRDQATDAAVTAADQRKQRWKERPGNRYTAAELRVMSESLGRLRILEQEFHVMRLD